MTDEYRPDGEDARAGHNVQRGERTVEGLSPTRRQLLGGAAAVAVLGACSDSGSDLPLSPITSTPSPTPGPAPTPSPTPPTAFIGAVYAGTNRRDGNTIAAFGRNANGTLTPIAAYVTGGVGGVFDGANDGVDPLISEDSIVAVDNRFLLAVNAGSNTISVLRINPDFSLTVASIASTGGVGPISIVHREGLVYVVNVDSDGAFAGPPDQSGNVTGFRLDRLSGQLSTIAGSTRSLGGRPSDVEISPDGRRLVISLVNAGSSMLAGRSTAQLLSFGVLADGNLTTAVQGTATSTLPGNSAGRNLPTSIGIEIVERSGRSYVIATEAREFLPNGNPGMLPMFQTGSISTWELSANGLFSPRSQDVLTGSSRTSGPTSACWIVVSPDRTLFWVASASGATISSFRLNSDGTASLIDGRAAAGAAAMPGAASPLANADGFIDIAASSDGRHIYQLLGLQGTINVYAVGSGGSLSRLQQATGLLPRTNIQGLAIVDRATA